MPLYVRHVKEFAADLENNLVVAELTENFQSRYKRLPEDAEIRSWRNSLPYLAAVLELGGADDVVVALEYQLPNYKQRVDCLLFGKDAGGADNVVQVELKQWETVRCTDDEFNFVETFVGGGRKIVLHPSQQAKGYHDYIKNFISAFDDAEPMRLYSFAYCHNYEEDKGLFDDIYQPLMREYPLYGKHDTALLAGRMRELLGCGGGWEVYSRFKTCPVRPSPRLLESVAGIIAGDKAFGLVDQQLVAKNTIWSKIRKSKQKGKKSVIIVHGGPGTGKTAIAINIVADVIGLKRKGGDWGDVFFASKSKSLSEAILYRVTNGGRKKTNAHFFTSVSSRELLKKRENKVDVLLVDEAHRIEKKELGSGGIYGLMRQLVRCAKTSVFFIDEKQNIRPQDIGSPELIRKTAKEFGCVAEEIHLHSQFRCMGSNDYLDWIDSLLGYNDRHVVLNEDEKYDFQVLGSPEEVYGMLQAKDALKPNSARLVAGFCWKWSNRLTPEGDLYKDVRIGDWAMPWETHGDISIPPKGYPEWFEWGYKPAGFKQVGCIYTAQGFDFEYVGVIIGKDLFYDEKKNTLESCVTENADSSLKKNKSLFDYYVRNIYRVLLTRGTKGCYVYCEGSGMKKYIESRMAKNVK